MDASYRMKYLTNEQIGSNQAGVSNFCNMGTTIINSGCSKALVDPTSDPAYIRLC